MSAGCDFVCLTSASGAVTIEGGRSGSTCGWNDWSKPTLSGTYVQAVCGTFGIYALTGATRCAAVRRWRSEGSILARGYLRRWTSLLDVT